MEKEKVKKYMKSELRVTLERRMQAYWQDPKLIVSPMDFTRMLRTYQEQFDLDESNCRTRTLDENVVDDFGKWLGYPLR